MPQFQARTRNKSSRLPTVLPLCLVAFVIVAAVPAAAQEKANASTVAVGGQRLPTNAATGRLERLTPQQAAALRETLTKLLNHSTEGLTVIQHPSGYEYVDLQGRFMSVAMIRRGAEGKQAQCVSSVKEAEALLNGTSPKARANERPGKPSAPDKPSVRTAEKE